MSLGVVIDSQGLNAPPEAQLKAYRAAQWTVMGFGVFGQSSIRYVYPELMLIVIIYS